MEEKITIEICVGTSCHLMGSNLIIDYLNTLPAEKRERIEIKHVPCMDKCDKGPWVRIAGVAIANATPEKLQDTLQKFFV